MTEEVKPVEAPKPKPWEEVYQLKDRQAEIGLPSSQLDPIPVAARGRKMPWEIKYEEKPRSNNLPTNAANIEAYLAKMTSTESGGDPNAQNPESTATGLHQFTEGTWLQTVKEMGKDYTLADRRDPAKSDEVVRYFTEKNRQQAVKDLGRDPSATELYLYHFLGAGAAAGFLKAPASSDAVDYVSAKAAASNRRVFYNKDGSKRSVGDVINNFARKF